MKNGYHPVSKFLHWAIVLLVLAQFANSDFIEEGGGTMLADFISKSHFSFGLLILPLALALLFMRFYRPGTRTDGEAVGIVRYAATAMQYLLYTLIFVVPLTGWVLANSRGVTLDFFGLFNLPTLMTEGSQYARFIGHAHEGFAWIIAFLASGHTGMALYHHFIVKDDALKRILPKFFVK